MNHVKLKAGLVLVTMLFAVIATAQPVNDDVCNATNITVSGVASCFSTVGATTTGSDPSHLCGVPAATVWFKFTAPASGTVKISTDKTGTNFNTIIALFSSSSCGGTFTEVGCNDDGSQLVVASSSDLNLSCLTPFEVYYIMVDGAGGTTGMVCIGITNNGGTALGSDFSCGFGANSPGLPILQANGATSCFSNRCAGSDADDPTGSSWSDGPENSIWMIFIAPASGSVKITTDKIGTTLTNQIAVYQNACPYLLATEIASDEGSGVTSGTSELTLCGLTGGSSYWIQVDGVAADTGLVCISVTNLSAGNRPRGADTICSASTLTVGAATSFFHNVCATKDSIEPAGSNWKAPGNAEKTTWHKFVAPASGNVTISTDFPQTNFDIQFAVYSSSNGTCNGTLTEVGSDDDSGTGLTAELVLGCLNSGTTYFIQVDGYAADSGDYGISVTANPGGSGIDNDSICDAIFLTVDSASVSGSNLCADTEAGETVPACFSLENSVYFGFAPPASGSVIINFSNTTFSLEFAVFKILDTICSASVNLNEVACDGTTLTNPSLSLSCLDPFAVYIIVVDGVAGETGAFDIQVQDNGGAQIGPDNACQATSFELIANGFLEIFTNNCAVTEVGEPFPPVGTSGATACTSNNGWCDTEPSSIENTIWVSFKPTLSGFTTISTDNDSTDFDTQLAVWEVSNCSNFAGYVLVAANDNCPSGCSSGNPLASKLTFCADTSKTYYVQIDGYGGATGVVGISATVIPLNAFAGMDAVVCADEDINLNASGGVGYVWSTGDTTAQITVHPLVATTYTVTVTGANGCTAADDVRITVDYNFPNANAGNDTFTCAFSPVTLTATGGVSYSWSSGDNTASTTVSPSITTNYSVTATGPNGCKDIDVVAVTVLQLPVANAGNDTTICVGSSANLKATGGASYSWSTGHTTSAVQVSPLADSTFRVTVTAANGCTASDSVKVFVASFPVIGLGNDTTICEGASLNLSTGSSGTFLWSTGSTNSTVLVSPVADSAFSVTVTSQSGCSSADTLNVTVNSLPSANVGDTAICVGESTQLIASGGGSYLWSTGETTVSIIVSPILTETYSITVTGTNGCVDSSTAKVTVNTLPVADAGSDDTICYQQSAVLNAGGGTGFAFSWSTGQTAQTITVKPVADSTYQVTVTNANGCSDTDEVTVFVYTNPILAITRDTVICSGSSVPLSVSGGDSYLWNTGETTAGILVTPDSLTRYIVSVTDSNLCVVMDTVVVFVVPLPVAIAGSDENICLGDNVVFIASGGTSYLWSTGATTALITVSPVVNTDYIVTVTTGNNCTDIDTVSVTVKPSPSVNLSDTTVCAGESVLLDAGSGGAAYVWSTSETTQTIIVNTPGTYSVSVSGSNGCNGSGSSTVSNFPLIILSLNDQNICGGAAVTLDAGNLGSSYLWSTGETSQMITVSDSGSYSVTVTDANGCTLADSNVIGVSALPLVNAGADDTICIGETAALIATGATTFLWSSGETSNILSIASTTNSTYSVTGTDANGCSASDSASVLVNDLPVVTLTLDPLYCINSGTRILVGGSPTGGTYSGNGVSGTTFDPVTAGLGSHVIQYDYADANQCSGSAQYTVLVDLCTDIEFVSNDFSISVYPNPFENKIMLNIETDKMQDVYIRLMDVTGRKIAEQKEIVLKGTNTLTMFPGDIRNGIYFLELTIDGKVHPVKLSRLF